MEKRKIAYLILAVVLYYSLISRISGSATSPQIAIHSQGTVNYALSPTPTPSPSPTPYPSPTPISAKNLCVIPGDWTGGGNGIGDHGNIIYPSDAHNGHFSIKVIDCTTVSGCTNVANEVNSDWIRVCEGDHIIMRCWVKTTGNTRAAAFAGARIGLDYYGSSVRICGANSEENAVTGIANDDGCDANYVKWGSGWTLREWDFYVPRQAQSDGGFPPYVPNQPPKGEWVDICAIIPWMQLWGDGRQSNAAWFAEFELYINP